MLIYYMSNRCKIIIKNYEIIACLNNSNTAEKIWNSLPLQSNVRTWGEEIYFYTSIDACPESNAKDIIELGELAFWAEGRAIAIAFGKTPISNGEEIRLAAKCNIWGTTEFNLKKLKNINNGELITIEKSL